MGKAFRYMFSTKIDYYFYKLVIDFIANPNLINKIFLSRFKFICLCDFVP